MPIAPLTVARSRSNSPLRVMPMIRQLRRKRLMEYHDERWVRRSVPNLCAIGERHVLSLNVSSACWQHYQPRHICFMNFGGIGEIALAQRRGFLHKMCLDQGNLRAMAYTLSVCPFRLSLFPGDPEPILPLKQPLYDLYDRASLAIAYSQPPVPPWHDEDMAWARRHR